MGCVQRGEAELVLHPDDYALIKKHYSEPTKNKGDELFSSLLEVATILGKCGNEEDYKRVTEFTNYLMKLTALRKL
jgi:hypothetical protein